MRPLTWYERIAQAVGLYKCWCYSQHPYSTWPWENKWCWWAKYGHWCHVSFWIAIDHAIRGGKIKFGLA